MNKKWYLQNPLYDGLGIVLAPLVALAIIVVTCEPRSPGGSFLVPPNTPYWLVTAVAVLVFMHVVLVAARSHLNRNVYTRFPLRFTAIPLVVFAAMAGWNDLFIFVGIAAVVWDEIHSFMQTFGFGRIYDSRLGNEPQAGRGLDMVVCFVLEYLPHLVLLSMLPYADFMSELNWGGSEFVQGIAHHAKDVTLGLIGFGALFIGYYVVRYREMVRSGYKISPAKIALFATTTFVNLFVICRYTAVEAGLVGNIYHSLQYFAVVWVSERTNLLDVLRVKKMRFGLWFVGAAVVVGPLMFGLVRLYTFKMPVLGALWLTMSLMHYWWDGFIWSVRRGDLNAQGATPQTAPPTQAKSA